MSLKKYLLLLCALLFVIKLPVVLILLQQIINFLIWLPAAWWFIIIIAIVLQLGGHILRTKRTQLVIDQVKKGLIADQFNALAIGYVFNSLLPFRLGEIIRALLIATKLQISFLYTCTAIVLERVIDLLLVGLFAAGVAFLMNGQLASTLLIAALGAMVFSLVILIGIILLTRENRQFLSLIWRITAWLNDTLRNRMRFKVWSLIYGLQQFMNNRQLVRRYIVLTLVSWIFYLSSVMVIIMLLFHIHPSTVIVTATTPYIVAGAPSTVLQAINPQLSLTPLLPQADFGESYTLLLTIVMMLPMIFIGLVGLFLWKGTLTKRGKVTSHEIFTNKLLRHEDISQEFPAFLDSYFSGNSLARILHKLEIAGELQLVKFFKGGSDAITVLVLSNDKLFVKKIIPLEYDDRLKAQYAWLQKHRKMKYNVQVLGEQRTDAYYAIDLAYDPENIPFFEFIHHNSLKQSEVVLQASWKALHSHLHAKAAPLKSYPTHRDAYIKKHIFGCIEKAAAVHGDLRQVLRQERLIINGEAYDNLYQILEKIKQCKPAWEDIATYRSSGVVHGDPSVDNILVSATTQQPLIIDPAPDGNIIEGAVFDMGKLMQSFYCGYEFSFRDDDPVPLGKDGSIQYRDHRSEKYTYLTRYIQKELAPQYLDEAERRAIIFHAGALHIRRLKHQVHFNYANTLKFYAVGVKTLNEFLAQYQDR